MMLGFIFNLIETILKNERMYSEFPNRCTTPNYLYLGTVPPWSFTIYISQLTYEVLKTQAWNYCPKKGLFDTFIWKLRVGTQSGISFKI